MINHKFEYFIKLGYQEDKQNIFYLHERYNYINFIPQISRQYIIFRSIRANMGILCENYGSQIYFSSKIYIKNQEKHTKTKA